MPDAATIQRTMFEVIERRDMDALRALYHDDYSYTDGSGPEQPGADAGIEVARTYTTAFPDLRFEFRHWHVPEDGVSIVEFTAHGTHTGPLGDLAPTGRTVEVPVCNVIETRDGRILREREYYDNLAIMRQLGVDGQ